jgi:hypothetical protein
MAANKGKDMRWVGDFESLVFGWNKSQESQGKVNYLKNETLLRMYLNDRVIES